MSIGGTIARPGAGRRRVGVSIGVADGPGGRVLLASVVIIALLGAAVAVSIWRYEHAIGQKNLVLEVSSEQQRAETMVTAFWNEREAANEFLLTDSREIFNEVAEVQTTFERAAKGLGADSAAEAALVAQARAHNDAFVATFARNRAAAGRGPAATGKVIEQLNAHETAILGPLEKLQQSFAREATLRQSDAATAENQALFASLAGGILALLGGIVFAAFALRLVNRIAQRESKLIDQANAQASMMLQVRTTASVLAGVANELRAAARQSAAATTEQSSAVAETSATIAQLAATATAIADNARAVAAAAEQTGDTMRDMQEKVARRALAEDRRDAGADQRDRRADEHAGAERGDRGCACR